MVHDILSRVRHSAFGPAHFMTSLRLTSSIGSPLLTGAFLARPGAGSWLARSGPALARLRARTMSAVFLSGALPDSTASFS